MRPAFCALALLAASIPAALAQTSGYAIQPNAVLQIQRTPILDGVWRVNGLGELSLTTRPNGVLEGSLRGRACHGQYLENTFSIFCPSDDRGPYIISGVARETPPVATTARSRVLAQPASMGGQIHQSYLSSRGHVEEIATLSATRH